MKRLNELLTRTGKVITTTILAASLVLGGYNRSSADEKKKSIPWAEIARMAGELGMQDPKNMTGEEKKRAIFEVIHNYGTRQHELDLARAGSNSVNVYNNSGGQASGQIQEDNSGNYFFVVPDGYQFVNRDNPNDMRIERIPVPRMDRVICSVVFSRFEDINANGTLDDYLEEIKEVKDTFVRGEPMRAYFLQITSTDVKGEKTLMKLQRKDGSTVLEREVVNHSSKGREVQIVFNDTRKFKPGEYFINWYSQEGEILSSKPITIK